MKTLKRSNISFTLDMTLLPIDTMELEFESSMFGAVGGVKLKDKYTHEILYKNGKIPGIDDASTIWIANIEELKKVIDEVESLPEYEFKYEDDNGDVLEEKISLRDFMKKYIYKGTLLEDVKRALGYIEEEILEGWELYSVWGQDD